QNNQNSIIMVLADGLGSGVKANILSTLTAKIISTMMEQSMPIEDCVNTIASTLPVCKDGETAYSTFTIIKITDSVNAEIIQYDNPKVILLRDGENSNYSIVEMTIENKKILYSKIVLKENDMLVSMSDGALHAGVESELNYNWKRDNIIDFLQIVYEQDFTAKTMTTILLDQCNKLYGEKPSDDTTVCTIKIRKRKALNLLFGPPSNYDDDEKMMTEFFSKKGLHVVCGGTTSQIAARFLGEEISENLLCLDPEIPPTAKIRGIELVTEGVITINKVLLYSENYLQ
ncbi:MAG: SpoIIE family protein phosphatase, partial [Oscillospiraceae bacterium]